MLTKVIFTLTIIVVCFAQQQTREEPVPILQYENNGVNLDGSYKFSYKTGNGIQAEESGYVKQLEGRSKEESEAQVVQGSYSYNGDDGQVYTVNYIADENGFRAESAHLPNTPSNKPTNYDEAAHRPIPLPPSTLRPPTTQPPTLLPPLPALPPVRVG